MLLAYRFISDFLASLSCTTRKALATVARLESYKKDQVSLCCSTHTTVAGVRDTALLVGCFGQTHNTGSTAMRVLL